MNAQNKATSNPNKATKNAGSRLLLVTLGQFKMIQTSEIQIIMLWAINCFGLTKTL